MKKLMFIGALALFALAARAGVKIDFNAIRHWAGTGENRAALIIQFNDGKSNAAYVWGYRWTGTASGEDMLRAVAGASRCLTPLVQYTGTMGSTLNGVGLSDGRELCDYLIYDFEGAKTGSSFDFYNPNTSLGQDMAPGDDAEKMCQDAITRAKQTGYIEHPINAFRYGYPSYDYDFWKLDDSVAEDGPFRWQSGWYKGYWSYWCGGEGDTTDDLSYSGLGLSSRQLVDGSIDLWNFNPNMVSQDPASVLDYEIAEYGEKMTEPSPIARPIDHAKVKYWVGSGEKAATVVFQFNDGKGPENLVYGYRWTGGWDENFETVAKNIAASDPRMCVAFENSKVKITYDSDHDGKIDGTIDHTDVNDTWNFYANRVVDNEYIKVPKGRWLNPGAVLIVSHQAADISEVKLPYQLFRPALDSDDIYTIPESLDYAFSDEDLVIPIFVQLPEGAVYSTSVSGQKDSDLTSVISSMSNKNLMVTVKFKNYEPASGKVWLNCYYKKAGETRTTKAVTNEMVLNVTAPKIPMTAIRIKEKVINSGLNKVIDYEYTAEPADATFTGVKLTVADTQVATWNASTGLKSTKKAGKTAVSVNALYDGENVKDEFTLETELLKPVTDVNFGPGTEEGVINVPVRQLIGLRPVVTPADADIPDVTVTLSDNGTSKDNWTCSVYKVNWWDTDNVRSQFFELSGHRPTNDKPAKVTVVSADGNFTREFVVNVIEADRTPLGKGYEDGTIILNEEWYGHTNGGLNYFTEDDEIIYQAYEKENPCMSFGATSQYGIVWSGKVIVVSKEATDRGDPLPGGGCLVIADAKTLKRLGSLDNLVWDGASGDGRAVAGATADKIYVSSSNGIYIVNIADPANPAITGRIAQENSTDLYSSQIGDMVSAGDYVFAVMQNKGLIIINKDTDVATSLPDASIQGVTQSADGNVWYATVKDDCSVFVALNPETLEEVDRVTMPMEIGTVVCSWGAWRSTAFHGSPKTNDLWFVTGAAGITGGASGAYYRYHIGDDPADIKPFFSLDNVTGINGFGESVAQMTYGTPRYDDRNDRLVVMTGKKGAASGGYRDHWVHYVDGKTQQITRTFKLNPYYWFQSLPIFPDKHDAEFTMGDINLSSSKEEKTYNLAEFVNDRDSHNANIRFSLDNAVEVAGAPAAEVADVSLEGKTLKVAPRRNGEKYFNLNVESNGKVVTKTVKVKVDGLSGITDNISESGHISCDGKTLSISGYNCATFAIYDVNGRRLVEFTADSDDYRAQFGFAKGIYILHGDSNVSYKFILK